MERLLNSLKLNDGQRFQILYGKGVTDSYITPNLKEVDFSLVLTKVLKKIDFRRIVFISPTTPIYFLDDESRNLSSNIIWSKREEVLSSGKIDEIHSGPFGNKNLFTPQAQEKNQNINIGDAHSIRMLDSLIKESSEFRTAIVIHQAETLFRYFKDQRTIFSLIGDWLQLPATNHNICFMDFAAGDLQQLEDQIRDIPFPQLISIISNINHSIKSKSKSNLVHISGPERKEISRLLQFVARENLSTVENSELEKLVDWIASEDESIKTWISRFSSVPLISLQNVKEKGWFVSSQFDPRSIDEKLNELVGLEPIKRRIKELSAYILAKKNSNISSQKPMLHLVFTGNPGTGKTTMARLIGDIYHEIGILTRGHVIEAKASDLVADYIGGTAIKTNSLIDQAQDGVLFIDEAYALAGKDRGGFGAEAMETLLTRMEDDRSHFVVILAGYTDQINQLLRSNPGLSRRFPIDNRFDFPDYSTDELFEILLQMLSARGLKLVESISHILFALVRNIHDSKPDQFGNAGEMRNLVESLERRCLSRIFLTKKKSDLVLELADISDEYQTYIQPPQTDVDSLMDDLNQMVGLVPLKRTISRMVRRVQYEQVRFNMGSFSTEQKYPFQHIVFLGNPGTGKTTVARLLGKIYNSLGLLRKGQCIEVTASDLIAGYVGQTASRTIEQIKNAVDGVLFIDEAYALTRGIASQQMSYGQEVIDALMASMEEFKGRLLVIAAGYPQQMMTFLDSNPGLKSRFGDPIIFEDFSSDELIRIVKTLAEKDQLVLPDPVNIRFVELLEYKKSLNPIGFGNARDVQKLYERMKDRLSERSILNAVKLRDNKLRFSQGWDVFILEDLNDDDNPTFFDLNPLEISNNPPITHTRIFPRNNNH